MELRDTQRWLCSVAVRKLAGLQEEQENCTVQYHATVVNYSLSWNHLKSLFDLKRYFLWISLKIKDSSGILANFCLFLLLFWLGLPWFAEAFSSRGEQGSSLLRCADFSLWWLFLLWSTGSRFLGCSICNTQAPRLWPTGLVASWHVESSQTRDQTRVARTGMRFLIHCATREVLQAFGLANSNLNIKHII